MWRRRREAAQGNVNPQLLVAVLTEDLAMCLGSRESVSR